MFNLIIFLMWEKVMFLLRRVQGCTLVARRNTSWRPHTAHYISSEDSPVVTVINRGKLRKHVPPEIMLLKVNNRIIAQGPYESVEVMWYNGNAYHLYSFFTGQFFEPAGSYDMVELNEWIVDQSDRYTSGHDPRYTLYSVGIGDIVTKWSYAGFGVQGMFDSGDEHDRRVVSVGVTVQSPEVRSETEVVTEISLDEFIEEVGGSWESKSKLWQIASLLSSVARDEKILGEVFSEMSESKTLDSMHERIVDTLKRRKGNDNAS